MYNGSRTAFALKRKIQNMSFSDKLKGGNITMVIFDENDFNLYKCHHRINAKKWTKSTAYPLITLISLDVISRSTSQISSEPHCLKYFTWKNNRQDHTIRQVTSQRRWALSQNIIIIKNIHKRRTYIEEVFYNKIFCFIFFYLFIKNAQCTIYDQVISKS